MIYESSQTCRHSHCSGGNGNPAFLVYFRLASAGLDAMPSKGAQYTYRCPHCRQSNHFQGRAFRQVAAIPPGAIVATAYQPQLSLVDPPSADEMTQALVRW